MPYASLHAPPLHPSIPSHPSCPSTLPAQPPRPHAQCRPPTHQVLSSALISRHSRPASTGASSTSTLIVPVVSRTRTRPAGRPSGSGTNTSTWLWVCRGNEEGSCCVGAGWGAIPSRPGHGSLQSQHDMPEHIPHPKPAHIPIPPTPPAATCTAGSPGSAPAAAPPRRTLRRPQRPAPPAPPPPPSRRPPASRAAPLPCTEALLAWALHARTCSPSRPAQGVGGWVGQGGGRGRGLKMKHERGA